MKKKILLDERDMPTQWYNIVADMPNKPLPPLHPATKQPVGPEDLPRRRSPDYRIPIVAEWQS